MKRYLLDTNTVIFALGNNPKVVQKLKKLHPENLFISSITLSEILFGIEKSQRKSENTLALTKFLSPFEIMDFTPKEAHYYARIRYHLESVGKPIGPNDTLIAATAVANSFTLVSNNTKEFSRVPHIILEDWK